MLTLTNDIFTLSIFIALTAAIYGIIMVVFVIARRKYKGGIVDKVIRYFISSIGQIGRAYVCSSDLERVPLLRHRRHYCGTGATIAAQAALLRHRECQPKNQKRRGNPS